MCGRTWSSMRHRTMAPYSLWDPFRSARRFLTTTMRTTYRGCSRTSFEPLRVPRRFLVGVPGRHRDAALDYLECCVLSWLNYDWVDPSRLGIYFEGLWQNRPRSNPEVPVGRSGR